MSNLEGKWLILRHKVVADPNNAPIPWRAVTVHVEGNAATKKLTYSSPDFTTTYPINLDSADASSFTINKPTNGRYAKGKKIDSARNELFGVAGFAQSGTEPYDFFIAFPIVGATIDTYNIVPYGTQPVVAKSSAGITANGNNQLDWQIDVKEGGNTVTKTFTWNKDLDVFSATASTSGSPSYNYNLTAWVVPAGIGKVIILGRMKQTVTGGGWVPETEYEDTFVAISSNPHLPYDTSE